MTPADAPAPGRASLDRALVRGIAWTGAVRWLTQVLSWASTLVVARLLTPHDYGLMGMATVYLGVVALANEFGLGAAIVQVRNLDEQSRATIGGLAVALGFLFFAVSAAVATPIAWFFGQPAVRDIVIVLAATFVVTGFRVLPYALLSRDLEFRRLAKIDATGALLQTVATLTLAAVGFRYWSLVLGSVLSLLASTAMSLAARPHRLAWPRNLGSIKEQLTLGWHVTVARLAWYAYSNADFAIVGRVLGTHALGAYSFGWQIASIPVDKVSAVLGVVALPVLSRVRDDLPAMRRYVKGLTEGLAIITFPLAFGLALVADHFVLVAVGPKWEPAIAPLRLLALYAGLRSLVTLFPQVLTAIGRARWAMWVSVALVLCMPASFFVGARWGTSGVAMAWVIVYPIVVVPMLIVYTLRMIGLPAWEYLLALWPATSATLAMATVVLLMRSALSAHRPEAASLAALVGGGAAAYGATLWLLHAARVRDLLRFLRSLRGVAPPESGYTAIM